MRATRRHRLRVGYLAWLVLPLLAVDLAVLAADAPLAEVRRQLQTADVLRGAFVQERRLPGFRHALRSSGQFLLARERGVLWRSEQPFASTLVLGVRGLSVDGQRQNLPDDGLQRVQRLLLALVGGDLAALENDFALRAETTADGWRLQATAHDPLLASRLRELELAGARWVERVSYRDEAGNLTVLRFSGQTSDPPQLSDDEQAWFD